jgi:circadian clock protein KaiC
LVFFRPLAAWSRVPDRKPEHFRDAAMDTFKGFTRLGGMDTETTILPATMARTGIVGLDHVLRGGLAQDRIYLVEGVPGSGKTTLAMQFLLEGARLGEPVLYVTLSETAEELRGVAESHGWLLEGIHVHELLPTAEILESDEPYTLFHPAEVELSRTTEGILSEVQRLKPTRVVFDSLSEIRLMAGAALRYRRQILALKRYFSDCACTVILLDDLTATERDLQVQSIAHGVILLEQMNPEYGAERRRLRVVKYRGVPFRGGYHDYVIRRGGLQVFPRLVAAEHRDAVGGRTLESGIASLDKLLGGGLDPGTSTLIMGAPGTGKSTLATQFVHAALERGEQAAMFVFDESAHTLLGRARSLGIDLVPHVDGGRLRVQAVDPAELAPGEFTDAIRHAVEEGQAKVVVIDSLNGYLNAMPEERFLVIQLHELLSYLAQHGVATIIVAAQQGLLGGPMHSPVDTTYLADGVILLRYFEFAGEVRQAISVIKKRSGPHERTIREFRLTPGSIHVGEALRNFHGVLTGVPEYDSHGDELTFDGEST